MSDYYDTVKKSLIKYYGKDVKLYTSTRKDKKFMVLKPDGKRIHFGQLGYDDYHTKKDEEKRKLFLQRNARWKNAEKWTPAHLSYWTLWN